MSLVDTLHFQPKLGGRILSCEGLMLGCEGLDAPIGALVDVDSREGPLAAEVVAFRGERLLLMALGRGSVAPGARVWLSDHSDSVGVGPALLGRVSDALGQPVDGLGPLRANASWPLAGKPLPPLDRAEVHIPVPTGVRAIDALLTLGRGQRVGLIAGSGVGKSVLMQQLVQGAEADAVVVGLIGERGREIAGFLADLAPAARARSHIIAVPADQAGPLRVRGAMRAFAIAEWLRSEGRHVLLILDSLTRVAHAQRETGLATGEPPGLRGYPPSALSLIPRLVERAGNDGVGGGAITALFTVLADGDDTVSDPVVDTSRGVLDGHIILDRAIASRGRFPAIDLGLSVSRTMPACVGKPHLAAATSLKRDSALVEANRDLLAMGAYSRGQDSELDRAMDRRHALDSFLSQPRDERSDFEATVETLVAGWGG